MNKTLLFPSRICLTLALLILPMAGPMARTFASPSLDPAQDADPRFDEVLVPCLKGILLIPPDEQTVRNREVTGVKSKGLHLPVEAKSKLVTLLTRDFIEEPLTLRSIQELKRKIVLFYRDIGRPVVLVRVPEQELTNSVLIVEILESKMGDVEVSGNKWSSADRMKRQIRLKPGSPIKAQTLVSDLAWINRDPYLTVNAIYKSGKNPGTTDIELLVKDHFPLSVYAGVDDTGFKDTGLERIFAGVNWSNAFNIDGVLSYQYTISNRPNEFMSHAASYMQPFPWRHSFLAFGGYSFVDARIQNQLFKMHGTSIQASARYQIPLPPSEGILHELDLGFDFKRTNNTVDFGGFTIINKLVNLFQYVAEYTFNYSQKNTKVYLDVQAFGSPGKSFSDMNDFLYQMLRFKAKNVYFYGRGVFSIEQKIPSDCSIYARLTGQGSTANLLPSEQLGLGGYNSVRGYYERQINADDAIISTLEFRTPPTMTIFKKCYNLHALAFADFAFGQEHVAASFERRQYYLLGVGPGLRFSTDWLLARLDWGIRVLTTQHDGPVTRLHFSVIGKY